MKKTMARLAMTLLLACSALVAQVARPNALWFNKVITVDRSRQLYVGLNANMWVLYDLPSAILYQAWQGGTAGGALATASASVTPEYWFAGGPHFAHIYRPSGASYFKDSVSEYFATYAKPSDITAYYAPGKWPKQPINASWGGPYRSWSVLNGATNVGATVRYRGYTVPGNVFTLKSGLILPSNGGEISVTESPEYSNLPSGNHLVRTFTFSGIPAGYSVRLEHLGGANAGAWSVTSGSATISAGGMVQTANGQTILNGSF